mmetsp:Transcript_24279/g.77936  ORF Transcript_24279/g.77936 Transcript_24279/m.77936 type:complete len:307 (-) Transcript_24279:368-1288(-)
MLVLLLPPHAAFQPSLRLLPLPHAAFAPLSPARCIRQHQMTEGRSGGVEGLSRLQLRRAIAERERGVRRQFRDRTTGGTSDVELEVLETDLDRILQASDLNGDGRIQPTEQQAAFSQWEQIASAKLRELEAEPPPVSAWTVAARLLTGEAARSTRAALDEELALERAAKLVELPVMFSEENGGSFDFERWNVHRSAGRYGRLLIGILFGVTTRRIGVTVSLLVAFSGLVDVYSTMARASSMMPEVELPLTPFELTAPVLGLLLVFRTDAAPPARRPCHLSPPLQPPLPPQPAATLSPPPHLACLRP